MKQSVKFLLKPGTINDATQYYCELIAKAFDEEYKIETVSSAKQVNKDDIVVTIRVEDFFKIARKSKKTINWFQGIVVDEFKLMLKPGIRKNIKIILYAFFEKYALKNSKLSLFVSDKMRVYYQKKYNVNLLNNYLIIPCYNKNIDRQNFSVKGKYEKLSFVYAGALFKWQCIEEMLQIFKYVQEIDNTATFKILSKQDELAQSLIKKYDVKNVVVDYCPLHKLDKELAKYKYGFLLRRNNIVNQVATPTKMNSYIASGIIPIYTDVVKSFEQNIDLKNHSLKFNLENQTYKEIAQSIINHHKIAIDTNDIYNTFNKVFAEYYNDEKYIHDIKNALKSL